MLKKDEKQIVCVAQFMAKEGKTDELLRALHSLLEPTHKEEGCVRYELNQAIENPRSIVFVEKFKDQKAFDFHCNTPHVKRLLNEIAPALAESFAVTLCKEILP